MEHKSQTNSDAECGETRLWVPDSGAQSQTGAVRVYRYLLIKGPQWAYAVLPDLTANHIPIIIKKYFIFPFEMLDSRTFWVQQENWIEKGGTSIEIQILIFHLGKSN